MTTIRDIERIDPPAEGEDAWTLTIVGQEVTVPNFDVLVSPTRLRREIGKQIHTLLPRFSPGEFYAVAAPLINDREPPDEDLRP